MLTTVLRTAILTAVMLADCLQAGALGDIHVLETGKMDRSVPAVDPLSLPENRVTTTTDRNVQNIPPAWCSLDDNRKVEVQDWKVVLFTQSTYLCCRQLTPVLKAFSQETNFNVLPISLGGKGDTEFPDMLPATPDVVVEYLQSGLPTATPTTFLANVNTMETWPLLQGAAEADEFRSRLNGMLCMAPDRRSGKSIPLNAQGQQQRD